MVVTKNQYYLKKFKNSFLFPVFIDSKVKKVIKTVDKFARPCYYITTIKNSQDISDILMAGLSNQMESGDADASSRRTAETDRMTGHVLFHSRESGVSNGQVSICS